MLLPGCLMGISHLTCPKWSFLPSSQLLPNLTMPHHFHYDHSSPNHRYCIPGLSSSFFPCSVTVSTRQSEWSFWNKSLLPLRPCSNVPRRETAHGMAPTPVTWLHLFPCWFILLPSCLPPCSSTSAKHPPASGACVPARPSLWAFPSVLFRPLLQGYLMTHAFLETLSKIAASLSCSLSLVYFSLIEFNHPTCFNWGLIT